MENPPQHKHGTLDSLHHDLLRLLDSIEMQDKPLLADERHDILKKHGYTTRFLTGPTGVVND